MRLDKNTPEEIRLTISERNARALLEKLTWDSARTIVWPAAEGEPKVYLSIEPDDEHYGPREPGVMLNKAQELY
jgi:hypothetical protein